MRRFPAEAGALLLFGCAADLEFVELPEVVGSRSVMALIESPLGMQAQLADLGSDPILTIAADTRPSAITLLWYAEALDGLDAQAGPFRPELCAGSCALLLPLGQARAEVGASIHFEPVPLESLPLAIFDFLLPDREVRCTRCRAFLPEVVAELDEAVNWALPLSAWGREGWLLQGRSGALFEASPAGFRRLCSVDAIEFPLIVDGESAWMFSGFARNTLSRRPLFPEDGSPAECSLTDTSTLGAPGLVSAVPDPDQPGHFFAWSLLDGAVYSLGEKTSTAILSLPEERLRFAWLRAPSEESLEVISENGIRYRSEGARLEAENLFAFARAEGRIHRFFPETSSSAGRWLSGRFFAGAEELSLLLERGPEGSYRPIEGTQDRRDPVRLLAPYGSGLIVALRKNVDQLYKGLGYCSAKGFDAALPPGDPRAFEVLPGGRVLVLHNLTGGRLNPLEDSADLMLFTPQPICGALPGD